MQRVMSQHLLGAFAFTDVTVNNHQPDRFPFVVANHARGRFQDAPRTVLVADSVFEPLSLAG